MESRNIKTQNCAPIQCTVWPRNDFYFPLIDKKCHFTILTPICFNNVSKRVPENFYYQKGSNKFDIVLHEKDFVYSFIQNGDFMV